ncbi:kelch-like protein 25 isoform X2 [Dreissena polymorpha]|uniref:BTB domain-containing protein n=2 Tax=Dreissena polymorpha TaxID=45954 RepID=A0A9D3YER0_DREPO|nr:kelch-like protein 25 isoform X2 [Dreissena polymorpha]XP_052255853.1 kelch-like protein 25 isoform X2 [Dreissena polymorpha]XP_052255854.1 kelch-like protein 25 isoform X2 [Dreissena polymorpha]XP_052255855.1 kelch-like protein 25 isoform X2 [Dreissena polymorpha]KAH3697771.1 hypothetical protein DPMN_085281 [Dreissena polymorpha]
MANSTIEIFNIYVEGKTIACIKDTLSKNSAYFHAMFNSGMKEAQNNEVTLHGQNAEIISILVDFMTSGELTLSSDLVFHILDAALMLQIEAAVSTCQSYLLTTLDDATCLQLASTARAYLLQDLYNQAWRHSLFYFTSVIKQPQFYDLDVDMLQEFLSEETLNCEREMVVLEAIHSWYMHNPMLRAANLPPLLGCVQCSDFQEEEWDAIASHPLVTDIEQGAAWYDRILQTKGTLSQRKCRRVPTSILLLGGEYFNKDRECNEPQDAVLQLLPGENLFKPVKKLSELYKEISTNMGFRTIVVGKDLYLTGGVVNFVQCKFFMDVVRYDGFSDQWSVATTLPLPRRNHAACCTGNSLYLIGGFGKYRKKLCSVQQYDTEIGEWKDLPPLPRECNTWQAACSPRTLYVLMDLCFCILQLGDSVWGMYEASQPMDSINLLSTPIYLDGKLYLFPEKKDTFSSFTCSTAKDDILCENEKEDESNAFNNFPLRKWMTRWYYSGERLGKSVSVFNGRFYTVTDDEEPSLVEIEVNGHCVTTTKLTSAVPGCDSALIVTLPCYPLFTVPPSEKSTHLLLRKQYGSRGTGQ